MCVSSNISGRSCLKHGQPCRTCSYLFWNTHEHAPKMSKQVSWAEDGWTIPTVRSKDQNIFRWYHLTILVVHLKGQHLSKVENDRKSQLLEHFCNETLLRQGGTHPDLWQTLEGIPPTANLPDLTKKNFFFISYCDGFHFFTFKPDYLVQTQHLRRMCADMSRLRLAISFFLHLQTFVTH